MYRGVFVVPLAVAVAVAVAVVAVACSSFEEGELAARDAGSDAGPDSAVAPSDDAGTVEDASVDATTCACPGRAPCGVPLVSTAGAFCIDPHEVTEGAYAEFVAANISKTIAVGAPCEPVVVTSRAPGPPDLPATLVTFCAARAYCAWAGKRLCGHVTGRPIANDAENTDLEQNAWLKACAGNGSQATLSGTCRRDLAGDAGPAPAKTTCEGAFPGIFDLQGNVWEWIDAPTQDDAGVSASPFVGGSWSSPSDYRCTFSGLPITASSTELGFRCCSP